MGGEISVASTPGRGSTFSFSVAFSLSSPAPLAAPARGAPVLSVLLLEAHPRAGPALLRLIEAFGAGARLASDDRAAQQLLAGTPFDLVLLSEGFPEPAGLRHAANSSGTRRRVIELAPVGASLRGRLSPFSIEKPILPGLLAAALFPPEEDLFPELFAAPAPSAAPAALTPAQAAVAAGAVLSSVQSGPMVPEHRASTGAPLPAELLDHAEALRELLRSGNPEAEARARTLARWAGNTPFARQADELLRQCSNFDFREALAGLDALCPPPHPVEN
jgi:hypothetical protein